MAVLAAFGIRAGFKSSPLMWPPICRCCLSGNQLWWLGLWCCPAPCCAKPMWRTPSAGCSSSTPLTYRKGPGSSWPTARCRVLLQSIRLRSAPTSSRRAAASLCDYIALAIGMASLVAANAWYSGCPSKIASAAATTPVPVWSWRSGGPAVTLSPRSPAVASSRAQGCRS